MNSRKRKCETALLARWGAYLIGLVFLALGNVLGIKASLGISANATTGYVLSAITGITIGTSTILFFALFIVIQLALAQPGEWAKILGQFPCGILFSGILDGFMEVLSLPETTYAGKIVLMLASVLFMACGVVLTVRTNLVPTPPDGLTYWISVRFSRKMGNVKFVFDIFCVVISGAAGMLFCGGIVGIGPGTIVSAALTGPLVRLLDGIFDKEKINCRE